MRILLTGAGGQVGFELAKTLAPLGKVRVFDHASLDLADPDALVRTCRIEMPDVIVNAAAYTAVDRAEADFESARAVNGRAPGILAGEAKKLGAILVHYSTDYVFDGTKRTPYEEGDPACPVNAYGRSKLEGEQAIAESGCRHFVLRTSWVYGPRGRNFLATMLALAATREEVRVVDDQRGAPTSSLFLAGATARLLRAIPASGVDSGVFHLTAAGETTWAGFARAIYARAAARPGFRPPRVIPIDTTAYPTPARRPAYSVLSGAKFAATFGFAASAWEPQLDDCFERLALP